MSIAVSALLRPSVSLRLLSAGVALCALGAGLALARGGFLWALPGGAASALAGLLGLLAQARAARATKPQRLDISGVGQIRLTVYQGRTGAATLLPGSTLWPGLLLLRLRCEDGATRSLPLWPGTVGGAAFRPLAVACRLIAVRGGEME
ncbi:flagellar hook-length control protein [Janthinobacterium fluminis]|uniref:Flagellar hook-length control protein n=1 Tax=Janthinobacterium fluminis TaxID=2987524 RepID=A0ABT5K0R1_9BURK|nr:flagellar hook-length control protein [Janthinobacterium fluminis]MDC8758444.1 flagellar hook-length control protein [Janthinobacterium fluminis]